MGCGNSNQRTKEILKEGNNEEILNEEEATSRKTKLQSDWSNQKVPENFLNSPDAKSEAKERTDEFHILASNENILTPITDNKENIERTGNHMNFESEENRNSEKVHTHPNNKNDGNNNGNRNGNAEWRNSREIHNEKEEKRVVERNGISNI
jgi:hypothetical protein